MQPENPIDFPVFYFNKILFLLKKYQILFLISGQEINKN